MTNASFLHSKDDLINYFSQGQKQPDKWYIGVEHEKFIFNKATLQRVPYDNGIKDILEELQQKGWDPDFEGHTLIGLKKGGAAVSLEPGGQFELSGAPLATLHEVKNELYNHIDELKDILHKHRFLMVGLGVDPLSEPNTIPWMPKERYRLMRQYMPTKGNKGLEMMTSTCTVQVNLDYQSERDMAVKMRVAMALQPLVTALFANSPFRANKDTGYASYRAFIWQNTDPDRCGLLPFVFEPNFTYEEYIDYALKVPMYFVKRKESYIPSLGLSFHDFMRGELPSLPGTLPTVKDWENHLSTLFPEVRLKKYLELRGADGGTIRHNLALPAFWVGLLYYKESLNACEHLVKTWDYPSLRELYHSVPQQGLKAKFKGRELREWALEFLDLSYQGLTYRDIKDERGALETNYLLYLKERLEHPPLSFRNSADLINQNTF